MPGKKSALKNTKGRPKSQGEPTETVGVRLPVSVKRRFKDIARANKWSLAATLRIVLEDYAENHPEPV